MGHEFLKNKIWLVVNLENSPHWNESDFQGKWSQQTCCYKSSSSS